MKFFSLIILLISFSCLTSQAISYEDIDIDIYGDTNFSKSETETLNTNLYVEYNIKIYEPEHKKWGLFVAGKVNPSYDHLGNEIKMDVFTVIGIDF